MSLTQSQIDEACADLTAGADVTEVPAWIETPKHTHRAEYDVGAIVYLKVHDEPVKGIVTGIGIRPTSVFYNVRWATGQEDGHFGIELTSEREL
jgi:hypothetical protein